MFLAAFAFLIYRYRTTIKDAKYIYVVCSVYV